MTGMTGNQYVSLIQTVDQLVDEKVISHIPIPVAFKLSHEELGGGVRNTGWLMADRKGARDYEYRQDSLMHVCQVTG